MILRSTGIYFSTVTISFRCNQDNRYSHAEMIQTIVLQYNIILYLTEDFIYIKVFTWYLIYLFGIIKSGKRIKEVNYLIKYL